MPSDYEKYATHHTSRRTDGWDYTQPAAYFVTICTVERACLFGTIERGRMYVNALGKIVATEWQRSETIRDRVHLDAFIIMPNHLHGIVVSADPDVGAPTCPRGYRAFGGWTDDGSDGAGKSTDSMNDDPGSTGVAGDPTGASNPEKASHGGATLGQSESDDGDPELHRPPRSLGSFIAGFKSAATTRINDHRDTPGAPVWQRNYHARIIRTERHWRAARRYIRRNPADWGGDRYH
jgi:putative transposase